MCSDEVQHLPQLREDLQLLPAPNTDDGSPAWTLYDPVSHRFFRIGALVFHMLSRWSAANGQQLIDQVSDETVFVPAHEDVDALIKFLEINQLTVQSYTQPSSRYVMQHKSHHANRWQRLLSQYLFFRVPLFRPDAFLNRTYPWFGKCFSLSFLYGVTLISIIGIYLVSRQWDVFINTFLHFFTLQGILIYALALIGTKVFHELGHVYTAKHYGCRIPSMGAAFMVMLPMMYSDMSDTWRLYSKKQRMHIAAAGIINELMLAGICLFIWSFLPEGILRSVCFVVATTSLISTLLINITPFMRFDGYYMLSDWWGIDNLQQRSFQLARWKLRHLLFGPVEEKPEYLLPNQERKLVCYAWITWVYRLILFTGIALLVYHFFFKPLGLILFTVEIVLLILMPVFKEIQHWRTLTNSNLQTRRWRLWILLAAVIVSALFIPWNSRIHIPGVLTSATHTTLYPAESAQIVSIAVEQGQRVEKDQVLMVLRSPALDKDIALARQQLEFLELRAMRAVANRQDQDDLHVILEQIAAESSRLEGLEKKQARLTLRAPFPGIIATMGEALHVHQWVNRTTALCLIMDPDSAEIKGIVSETDLNRIESGQPASFYPEDPQLPELTASLHRIDWGNIKHVDLPYLASPYGGDIAVRRHHNGMLVPETTVYAIYLNNVSATALQKEIRGSILISGKPISIARQAYETAASVIIRESGF
ncbi:MAG: HlyD family efflux transporter periplasmic adaptor subunit [Nitrosomonas sp.]|nr:MAG: HlyD family efflux transporter periplasmic adaptor subunit [Nitrosomonas sp.]